MVDLGIVRPNSLLRNALMAWGERRGCCFLSSIDHGVSFLASLATVLASLAAQTAELVLTKSPHLAS